MRGPIAGGEPAACRNKVPIALPLALTSSTADETSPRPVSKAAIATAGLLGCQAGQKPLGSSSVRAHPLSVGRSTATGPSGSTTAMGLSMAARLQEKLRAGA